MNEQARQDRFYFKLFDRLDGPGCPICGIVIDDSRAYLDSVLYERVTDVPTREGLRESFGLCNPHTWLRARGARIERPGPGLRHHRPGPAEPVR